jgi:hypothetical protein
MSRRVAILLVALLGLAAFAFAQDDRELRCRVTYVSGDGFYVDAGSDDGITEGISGFLRVAGTDPVEVQVVAVAPSSARVRPLASIEVSPTQGDEVVFQVEARVAPPPTKQPAERNAPAEFVPLLEQQKHVDRPSRPKNISHGWVGLRQLLHFDGTTDFNYATTLLGLRGSVTRLAGSAWTMRWNGSVQYRAGDAFENSSLEGGRLMLYEFSFTRGFDSGGFVKLGRLLPAGLRVGGYLDGAQAEHALSDSVRIGTLAGLRPERKDLAPSLDEPTILPYLTFEAGQRGKSWFSATAGLLGSWYEGQFDRLALLAQLHYENGRHLRLDSTIDFDFDVDAAEFKSGSQLTFFDLIASGEVTRAVTYRVGAHRFERVDNRAERAQAPYAGPEIFLDSFWRTWIGLGARLGRRWSVDGEVAWIMDDVDPTTLHWRVRGTHFQPFGVAGSNLALTVFNLKGTDGSEGIGARLTGWFPFDGGKWNIQPGLGLRGLEVLDQDLEVADVRARLERVFDRRWSAHLDASYATGTELDSLLVELGVSYRW